MKTRLLIIIVVTCISFVAQAQTMKEIFTTLPDSILPTLSKNDRLDCVDLIENNMNNEITNRLHGKSRLTMLTDDLAKLQLSSIAEMQMKKIETNDGYVVMIIHSVKIDTWDSTIKIYDKNWQLVNTNKYVKIPVFDDFFTKSLDMDDDTFANKKRKIDFSFIYADIIDDNIVFTLTTSNDNEETFKSEVKPLIKNPISIKLGSVN